MNPVFDALLGGWEVNLINTAHTGLPSNVYYGASTANDNTGLTNDYRGEPSCAPNVSGASTSQSEGQMVNNYFAGYTFHHGPRPARHMATWAVTLFRAPGFEQADLAANKSFRLGESIRLQFRSEFFNVLNHTNFLYPTNVSTSAAFGQIRSTLPARQIQFGLKLIF